MNEKGKKKDKIRKYINRILYINFFFVSIKFYNRRGKRYGSRRNKSEESERPKIKGHKAQSSAQLVKENKTKIKIKVGKATLH